MPITIDRFIRAFTGISSPRLYDVRKEKVVTALGDLNTFIYQLDRADGPAQDLRETSHALNQRVQAADQLKPRNLQKACKDLEPVKSDARQAVAEAKQAIKDNTNYQRRLDKVNKALREALVAVRGLEDVDATDSTLQERYEELVTKRDDVIDIIDGHHTFLTAGYKKLDVIKSEARTVAKDARGAYADKLKDPDTRVQVEIEGMDEPVEFHPVMLPGFENLNREEREEKLAAIGEKVKKGNLLIKQLTENPGQFDNIDPTVENVADLMWALQIKAEQATGKPFSRGAMSIPDPDSKIRKFLDRCMNVKVEGTVEAYNRQSSHLTEHQEISGGSSRGIDMYDGSLENPESLMPYGLPTVTYSSFSLDREEENEDRLYLKMETHGARISKGKGNRSRGDDVVDDRETRGPHDLIESIKHGLNFIFRGGYPGAFETFRESQIPASITTPYGSLIKEADRHRKQTGQPTTIVDTLKEGNWAKELSAMYNNIMKVVDLLPVREEEAIVTLSKEGNNLLLGFIDACNDEFEGRGGDLYSRLGNEAVLTRDDLV